MADPVAHTLKRCFGDVAMHVTCVRNSRNMTFSVLRWKIEKFLMLKDTVRYKWKVETPDWILKLVKKRYFVTVTIESENKYRATTGFVCYESLKFSNPVTFEEVCGGVYKAEFGPKIVNHKDNEILNKHGRLELCFPFEMKCNLRKRPCLYPQKMCQADEDILKREVSERIKSGQSSMGIPFADFVILVEKETFFVHKAILRMRSPFLGLYIDKICKDGKKGGIMIKNTVPEVMGRVLSYIYKGSSVMPKDVDLRIRIFKLACFFCIYSLWSAYLAYLLRDINETNVVRMKEAGISTKTPLLIQAADEYVSKKGISISNEDGRSTARSDHSSIITYAVLMKL